MTENPDGRLAEQQAGTLRWQARIQAAVFGFVALSFGGIGVAGTTALLRGGLYPEGTPWLMTGATLLFLGVFLTAGLIFAWLSAATLRFAFRLPDVIVRWYEGVPDKATFTFRQQASLGAGGSMATSPRLAGAWLRHDGRKFAVDLDLFRRIPDQGTFRFHYIRRPGFPGVLTPYLIVGFAPVTAAAGESGHDSPCQCMTPASRAETFDIVPIGTDETHGRFGAVSLHTCKACGQPWLHYHVEYEAFEKSGRWFRGPVSPETAQAVRPETAVAVLGRMEWYFAGGSYFESTGFKSSGAPTVDA